ncbi:MAG: fatty acid hydroxylase family protein [Proteobacteria bacterium]|nr:fatty acid hydroxylase family protein [Pseudomonadota bacterium]
MMQNTPVNKPSESDWRDAIPTWYRAGLHYFGTSAVSLPVILYGAITAKAWIAEHGISGSDVAFIPAMLVIASLVEYLTHRFPLHHRLPFSGPAYTQHTLRHHQFFTHSAIEAKETHDFHQILFPVWGVALIQYGLNLPLALLLWHLADPMKGALALILGPAFFFAYETIHAICHFPLSSRVFLIPGLRFLREHHRIHHHKSMMSRWNFNIVFPLWDWILGTRAPEGRE